MMKQLVFLSLLISSVLFAVPKKTITGDVRITGATAIEGVLSLSSGITLPVASAKTTTYTIAASDSLVPVSGSGAGFTVTLPAASAGKQQVTVFRTDQTLANVVTLSRAGSDTISSAALSLTSLTLNTLGESYTLRSDGSSVWYVIHHNIPAIETTYTPTFGGISTNYTGLKSVWWRRGIEMCVRVSAALSSAVGATITTSLPSGVTIDNTNVGTSLSTAVFGACHGRASGGGDYQAQAIYSTTTVVICRGGDNASSRLWNATTPITWAASDEFGAQFCVPISGWKQ